MSSCWRGMIDAHRRLCPFQLRPATRSIDRGQDPVVPRAYRAERWQYLHAYIDRAPSGASGLRPGYQSVLEDVRCGQFDVVVAEALDCLSRDQEDVVGPFSRIRLITLTEGEITELHVGLTGTMNAIFLKDLADKTRLGLRGRVSEGCSAGGIC